MNLKTKKILANFGLITTLFTLSGCSDNKFKYNMDTDGEIVVEGNISYSDLKKYKLIELKKINNTSEIYICSKITDWARYYYYDTYYDILTDISLYGDSKETNLELIKECNLEDYLITYDEIKKEYSIDDIERILEEIKQDYEYTYEKTKVKGE